ENRWVRASFAGVIALALLAAYIRLSGCLAYWRIDRLWFLIGLPPIFLFLLLGLRSKARIALAGCVVVAAYFFFPPHFNPVPIASSESNAVEALFQMRASLESEKSAAHTSASILPPFSVHFPVQQFYRFDYFPDRSAEGVVRSFKITAT